MKLRMILVYGRRSESEDDPELSLQRSALLPGDDEELVSFDRLAPDAALHPAITVRATGFGRYTVVHVPPTFALGPCLADRLLVVDGFDEVIDRGQDITDGRKQFLKARVPYWRAWAQSTNSAGFRVRRVGQWE